MALVIVGILAGTLLIGLGLSRGVMAADSAREAFMALGGRARSLAVQRGVPVRLKLSASQDRAWLETDDDGLVEVIHFHDTFGADVQALPGELTVCINTRGYADPECNNFGSAASVTFEAGGEYMLVTVYPLGQMITG